MINKFIKLTIIIVILFLPLFNKKHNNNNLLIYNANDIIYRLKKDELKRIPKYILLMDFYQNPYCNDLNAYYIFKYYQENNNNNAYYIINCESDLYKQLTKKNKTQNLIPVNSNDNIIDKLYKISK